MALLSGGESTRHNAVISTCAGMALTSDEVHRLLRDAADLYALFDLPGLVEVGPGTDAATNQVLEAAGEPVGDIVVMSRDGSPSPDRRSPGVHCSSSASPSDVWLQVAAGGEQQEATRLRRVLARVPLEQRFVSAEVDQETVGVLRLAFEDDVSLVFNLRVHPAWRRRGIGERLMQEVDGTAVLQVDRDNHAAMRLYESLRFTPEYDYHHVRLPMTDH